MTDRAEFIDAARDQAFTDPEGRQIIHCWGSFTGADWDLDGVIAEIDGARDVRWIVPGDGHELAVLAADDRIWRFAVTRPVPITGYTNAELEATRPPLPAPPTRETDR